MVVPRIENLRRENWQMLSPAEPISALQDLENALAGQEGRQPCTVDYLSNCPDLSADDQKYTRGLQAGQSIFINDDLVSSDTPSLDTPYMATETLFHESRHAYQDHVAANPELAADPHELQDFQLNKGDGYLSPKQYPPEYYLWQPVEKDAREVARQRTEELYEGEFQDNTQYPEHRRQMEAEEETCIQIGRDYLGDNYEELARQEAYGRSEQFQMERQLASQPEDGDGKVEEEAQEITQPTAVQPRTEERRETVGETAGQVAGEATAGPADGAAEESVAQEAAKAAGQVAQEQAETAAISNEMPASASSEPSENQDYDYGYSYGY